MKLINHLNFTGQCREAFTHYQQVLGGTLEMHPYSGMPGNGLDVAWQEKLMHASLQMGDQALMGSDSPPQYAKPMGGFSVSLHTDSVAESKRIYEALLEGGQALMPAGETPWSPFFAMLWDRFGTPWMINTNPAQKPA